MLVSPSILTHNHLHISIFRTRRYVILHTLHLQCRFRCNSLHFRCSLDLRGFYPMSARAQSPNRINSHKMASMTETLFPDPPLD